MGDWEYIYKKKGKVYSRSSEGIKKVIEFMKKNKVKRVLDLGFGSGRHVLLLAKNGFDVYGTDISKEGMKLTLKDLKKLKLKA